MKSDATRNRTDETGSGARRPGFIWAEVVIVLVVIGLLVALLLPATQTSCGSPTTHCRNNVKQIALALQIYHDEYGSFPPAHTIDADGQPLHSWRTLILPVLGERSLYATIDLSKPWDDPANVAARAQIPQAYRCPKRGSPRQSTTYLALVAPGGCLQPGSSHGIAEIADELEKTALVVEVDESRSVDWMAPSDADMAMFLALGAKSKLPHARGILVGYADGGTSFLAIDTPAAERRALITAAAGD